MAKEELSKIDKASIVNVPTQVDQAYQLEDGRVVNDKEMLLEIYNIVKTINKTIK